MPDTDDPRSLPTAFTTMDNTGSIPDISDPSKIPAACHWITLYQNVCSENKTNNLYTMDYIIPDKDGP